MTELVRKTLSDWYEVCIHNEPEEWAGLPIVARTNVRQRAWSMFRQAKIDNGQVIAEPVERDCDDYPRRDDWDAMVAEIESDMD